MSANFNFYLNRQGAKGRKGDKGEQGYSPSISVETETAAEYVLKIQNEGYSFTTPNLRGNAIENTGGTYIRYNTATGQMYTGGLDLATVQRAGAVMITPTGGIAAGGSTNDVPTSAEVYDYVESKITSIGEGYVKEEDFTDSMEQIASELDEKISFDNLASSLVAGSNITLVVDSEDGTITINSSGGDLSNYVTLNTEQTLTAKKISSIARSGSNVIYNVEFNGGNNASLRIGSTKGSNDSDNDIPVIIGNKLRIGTTESNLAPNFVCPSSSSLPSIGIFDITNTGIVVTDATWHPIFSDLNVTFGTGLTVITSGAGMSKKYTISASSPDLSNYVTLDAAQTITGQKGFTSEILAEGGITLPIGNSINFHSPTTGSSGSIYSPSANTLQIRANTININSGGSSPLVKNLFDMIRLSDLSIASASSDWLSYDNTTGEFSANVDTVVTQNSDNLITSSAVYDAIQSSVGNIETLLNNINSGSGS